jgi:hypothetical protein
MRGIGGWRRGFRHERFIFWWWKKLWQRKSGSRMGGVLVRFGAFVGRRIG